MDTKAKSLSSTKEKITFNTIIFITGILFSIVLLLLKISWINIDWRTTFIPLMIALQIIFLSTAIKNRYKKI